VTKEGANTFCIMDLQVLIIKRRREPSRNSNAKDRILILEDTKPSDLSMSSCKNEPVSVARDSEDLC